MRHRKSGVKLNRTTSHRQAMFRNMVTSLFKYGRIKTTEAKAKELRRWADHIVTLAKRGDLHARRKAMSIVREKQVVHKVFEQASGRYGSVNGGYTRIVKIGRRPGDAATMTLVELIRSDEITYTEPRKKPATVADVTPVTEAADAAATPATDETEPVPVAEAPADEAKAADVSSQDAAAENEPNGELGPKDSSEPADTKES
ncbi:MAG: 50S ribosomal protein L17 [Proteobacteria bacterium]|nr:MAG: 50S ribosomal protein L17 [Pseudomonadota bacterium]PIE66952.1 MAG: 50S ribosomal protein L17 [Deltaproteobacteria bacterium]